MNMRSYFVGTSSFLIGVSIVAGLYGSGCSGEAPPKDGARSGSGGAPAGAGGQGGATGMGGGTVMGGASGGGQGGAVGTDSGGLDGGPGAGSAGGAAGGVTGAAGAGAGGTAGKGGSSANDAGGCNLPAVVSFQKDVQSFLITSCGGGNGCHVIDAASTTANGGYNHAYDWITAGAHPSSCPSAPTPKRFEIVMAVINGADPVSCFRSRIMPPQNEIGANLRKPLAACQIALLQGWLDEPLVTQSHRVDDTDPAGTAPFPMPPFN